MDERGKKPQGRSNPAPPPETRRHTERNVNNLLNKSEAMKKEIRTPQTGISSAEKQAAEVRERLRSLSGSYGKSLSRLSPLCRRYLTGIAQLSQIFAVLQTEEEARQAGLSTSLPHALTEAERYISECLADLLQGIRGTSQIPSLLREYGVVIPLPDGRSSVSPFQIHLILQDNFQDSSLCRLFNVMFGCYPKAASKTVIF